MPRPVSILVAINHAQKESFLPSPLSDQLETLSDQVIGYDPTGVSLSTWHDFLQETNPEIIVGCWSTPRLPEKLPPRTRYLCYLAGSVRNITSRRHIEQGLIVSDWGSSISCYIAEAALMHILSCLRQSTYWTMAMHNQRGWKVSGNRTATLFKRKIGLHGFGRIAREFTKLLTPFNCEISVFAPDVEPTNAARLGVIASPSLDSLFTDNDIVVELAPLNEATRGSITERHLRLLSPGNVFVNVGRAGTVDEAALLKIAQEGKVQIGLDVFHQEPLAADSPLRGLENVNLSPHNAGPTDDGFPAAGEFSLANIQAYCNDAPIVSRITPERYDQST